jgi:O-methyltransferase involved in polyketide biosynthesis
VAASDPLISNVSDTARWVATYRAVESARPDALFHDPLADRLAGDRGRAIVAAAPRAIRNGWWLVARTKVMDDVIIDAITDGCDRVLNLAAGAVDATAGVATPARSAQTGQQYVQRHSPPYPCVITSGR